MPPHEHKITVTDGVPMFDQIQRVDTLVRCNLCGSVIDGDVVGTTQHMFWHARIGFTDAVQIG